jgi:UDP-N-acetylmuramoylalanine--D-glutamate ligase
MKRIVILGAGESGAGAAVLAKVKGFETFVSDMSAIKDKYKELLDSHQIAWEEGHHTEELILNADEVIKSPGIPNDAPIILKLKAQGTPVISEIEFAGRYTDAKMICITGSNGKTTTTSLIYHIFKSAGLNVGLAGNIGKSLALQVAEDYHDYYIIELSSFQLDNMYNFRANIAVLMNITPDHLDRYDHCMQNYIDAKFRITQNQTPDDAFIFWNDDPIIRQELAKHGLKAHLYPFAAVKEDGAIAYVEDHEVKITEPIAFNMEQEELALTGQHNLYNSLAAGISANLAGIAKENIRKALSDFKGVEHRLEKVARVRGIDFINDSKATNVNSCWYALQSMTTKTVLILGGKDKGNDYTEIEDLVREKCSALVYLGLHNEKLHEFFDRFGLPVADAPAWTPAPPFAPLTPPKDCTLPSPDTDPFADYDATRPQEVLTCAEALELAIKALKLFPINVYNDLYADIVGHETYAGTVQCAAQNDLIPAAWIADGRLYPQRTVTAADFLAVLMPGAAGRRPLAAPSPLPDSVPAYARFAAGQAVAEQLISADSLNDPITRSDAAALCRRLHI